MSAAASPLTQGEWAGRYEEPALRERTQQAKQEHEAHFKQALNAYPSDTWFYRALRAVCSICPDTAEVAESVASEVAGEELRKDFRCVDLPLTPRLHQALSALSR